MSHASILPATCRFASASLLLLAAGGAASHEAEARYLGNEGVLVAAGEQKVLFDAFFSDDYGEYVLVDADTRAALNAGRPPYDGVDAVFVSHVHGDHFSPAPMLAYLRERPRARVFAPAQVVDVLQAEAGDDAALLSRVTAFDLAPGDPAAMASIAGFRFAVVAIPHAGGAQTADIQNLAFRVSLAPGPTVIHLGDAGADPDEFARQADFWSGKPVDLVLPPFWLFTDPIGRELLERHFPGSHAVGIHVPAEAAGDGAAWREHFDADLFADPGETRAIDHHHDQ